MIKIGKNILLFLILTVFSAHAADRPHFTAEVDSETSSRDEPITLIFTVQTTSNDEVVGEPSYSAPDFDELQTLQEQSTEIQMTGNGIQYQKVFRLKKILQPLKTGTLTIKDIQLKLGNELLTAPNINVEITPGGAGTAPPRGYGSGTGLSGAAKNVKSRDLFLKAELSQSKIYKGEQLIVSFYLFSKVQLLQSEITKFPTFHGLLREELDGPTPGRPTQWEQVILDGVPYRRALMARYAAYPLEVGNLKIDSFGMKIQWVGKKQNDFGSLYNRFFMQMAPQVSSVLSEPVTVQVVPLPENGAPKESSGAVGKFEISSAVDRDTLRAHEPLKLTVKISGRGNLGSVKRPAIALDSHLEIYETKERANVGKSGVGDKIYELTIVPKKEGKYQIPVIDFFYFDPSTSRYIKTSTESIPLTIEPSLQSFDESQSPNVKNQSVGQSLGQPTGQHESEFISIKSLKTVGFIVLLVLVVAGAIFGSWWLLKQYKQNKLKNKKTRTSVRPGHLDEIAKMVKQAMQNTNEFSVLESAIRMMSDTLWEFISKRVPEARGRSRSEVARIWEEDLGLNAAVWKQADQLFDFFEMVQVMGRSDLGIAANARNQLESKFETWKILIGQLEKGKQER